MNQQPATWREITADRHVDDSTGVELRSLGSDWTVYTPAKRGWSHAAPASLPLPYDEARRCAESGAIPVQRWLIAEAYDSASNR